jgi:hypothetical protein
MVNINRQIMLEDAGRLPQSRSHQCQVVEKLRQAKQVRAKTAAGTDHGCGLESRLSLGED